MSRKNNLRQFKNIDAEDMSQSQIISAVTCIQWLDNIGQQLNFTGAAEGTFEVQVSADYEQDMMGNVVNTGNWIALDLSPAPVASGSPDTIYIDITQISAPWMRTVFNNSELAEAAVATVADTGLQEQSTLTSIADTGVLATFIVTFLAANSTTQADYFVMESQSGNTYAFWMNKNGNNTPPTGAAFLAADFTAPINISTGQSATTVRGLAKTVLEATFLANEVPGLNGQQITVANSSTNALLVTQANTGVVTAPAVHNADDSGAGTLVLSAVNNGAASNLGGSYFHVYNANNGTHYYGYIVVNGETADPALPGATGILIAINPSASANTIGTAMRNAFDVPELAADFTITGATNQMIVTNVDMGLTTNTSDGATPTGFTFLTNTQGATSNLLNTYWLISANGEDYYIWNNVNGEGVDPMVPGSTEIEIVIAASATANDIATAIGTALAAIPEIDTISVVGNDITFSQVDLGPFVVIDSTAEPTEFTISSEAGAGGTLNGFITGKMI